MSDKKHIHDMVGEYYTNKLTDHGATHTGVDWNSTESQFLRFKQLLAVQTAEEQPVSIIDYGCGYGALIDYLEQAGLSFTYTGYDIATAMIEEARKRYGDRENCQFTDDVTTLTLADYTIASGIFNVRMEIKDDAWLDYILKTINAMWDVSRKGIAFNCLTSYSDVEYMRSYLYYTNPLHLFDYCKKNFSKQVALLHDYGLYEFTMIVRREI